MLVKLLRQTLNHLTNGIAGKQGPPYAKPSESIDPAWSTDAVFAEARAHLSKKDLGGARLLLERAMQLGARNSELFVLLATVYAQQQELGRARDMLIEALELW